MSGVRGNLAYQLGNGIPAHRTELTISGIDREIFTCFRGFAPVVELPRNIYRTAVDFLV